MFANHELREPTITHPDAFSHRDFAQLLYKERRARSEFFKAGMDFWSDPAWDMLLDIFIANEDGRLVSVTSACIGGCVPMTTGLRRVDQLLKAGLVRRFVDPSDRRRGMLSLTIETAADMRRYLDKAARDRR